MGRSVYTGMLVRCWVERGLKVFYSIHSSTAGSCTDKMWPEYDPQGFSAAESSIKGYAQRFFCKPFIRVHR
jgi:hypothetical protein